MADAKNTTPSAETVDAESTEIAIIDSTDDTTRGGDVASLISSITDTSNEGFYSSLVANTFEDRIKIAAAMTTSEPVDKHLGEVIQLENFIVQVVTLVDDDGTVNDAPRVILIDADGTTYHATSTGLLGSLRNIVKMVGEPAVWEKPIAITVNRERTRKGFNVFTIRFV